jgi:hypothetical protein
MLSKSRQGDEKGREEEKEEGKAGDQYLPVV